MVISSAKSCSYTYLLLKDTFLRHAKMKILLLTSEDEHWRDRDYDRSSFTSYRNRSSRSYRGRGRGGGRGPSRSNFRHRQEHDFSEFPADYIAQVRTNCLYCNVMESKKKSRNFTYFFFFCWLQMKQFSQLDPSCMMPFMGTFYFNNPNYVNMDATTIKEYIRKQM